MSKFIDTIIGTSDYARISGKDKRVIQMACKSGKELPQVKHVKRIGREYVIIMKNGYEKYF